MTKRELINVLQDLDVEPDEEMYVSIEYDEEESLTQLVTIDFIEGPFINVTLKKGESDEEIRKNL